MSVSTNPSDGDPTVVPSGSCSERSVASVLPVVRITSEDDTGWLRHLGLPFFYRHTPSMWIFRCLVYGTLFVIICLLVLNLILIPYSGGGSTADDPTLMSQFFVIAIVLSCILAPLISTFSLCNERVMGTLEFLRLAPFSTTAIVLGKSFAPVYPLHLTALGFLGVGFGVGLFGVESWTNLHDLCAGVTLILLSAVLVHALGAFLASLTTFMRGIGSVVGLVIVGGALHFVPLSLLGDRVAKVLSCFSPWGVMDSFYWHSTSWWRGKVDTQIFDSESLAVPFLIAMHLALSALLFRAAARRMDSPLRTALSPMGHLSLWTLLLITCAGVGLNDYRWGQSARGWEAASVLMCVLGSVLILFMIFDHPHRRELVLGHARERISAGQPPPGSLRNLGHATLVGLMTLLTAIVTVTCLAFTPALPANAWGLIVLAVSLPPVLALLCCLLLESNQVGLRSAVARGTATVLGLAVLIAIQLAAVIDVAYTLDTWSRCFYAAEQRLDGRNDYWRADQLRQDYPKRFTELDTREKIDTARDLYRTWPVVFFLKYHPLASALHLGMFLAYIAGLFTWRWRAYRVLRREAQRAVQGVDPVAQPLQPSR